PLPGAHAAEHPVTRPVPQVPAPAVSVSAEPAVPVTSEVPAYVDESLPEVAPELEVPRVLGADAEVDEIDLPDFLR
ncbi:cell division protein FtsZ, partial [Actinomyces sp. 186855]|nr:cell division protein FtsZ [Actinomyces sp. 186855]